MLEAVAGAHCALYETLSTTCPPPPTHTRSFCRCLGPGDSIDGFIRALRVAEAGDDADATVFHRSVCAVVVSLAVDRGVALQRCRAAALPGQLHPAHAVSERLQAAHRRLLACCNTAVRGYLQDAAEAVTYRRRDAALSVG